MGRSNETGHAERMTTHGDEEVANFLVVDLFKNARAGRFELDARVESARTGPTHTIPTRILAASAAATVPPTSELCNAPQSLDSAGRPSLQAALPLLHPTKRTVSRTHTSYFLGKRQGFPKLHQRNAYVRSACGALCKEVVHQSEQETLLRHRLHLSRERQKLDKSPKTARRASQLTHIAEAAFPMIVVVLPVPVCP